MIRTVMEAVRGRSTPAVLIIKEKTWGWSGKVVIDNLAGNSFFQTKPCFGLLFTGPQSWPFCATSVQISVHDRDPECLFLCRITPLLTILSFTELGSWSWKGSAKVLRVAGGKQRPVLHINEVKKKCAHSARALSAAKTNQKIYILQSQRIYNYSYSLG
jgi:hypothetical protein